MKDGTAVQARKLTKRFGRVAAVDAIDLTVPRGGVHGLLGPNGAGKTTVLRMLLGLVRPDAGTLAARGPTAGFVDDPCFYPYLTAERNLALLADLDGDGAAGRVDEALERVDLTARRKQKVAGYSFGMRRRLGIAAALIRSPHLMVLDEPANGLDPAGVRAMRELVRGLADDDRTVLLSSHNMAETEELCDTVTVMRDGMVVHSGTIDELRDRAPDPAHRLWTGDDPRAVRSAAARPDVRCAPHADGGLAVHARPGALDAYVLALAGEGIPVRALRLDVTPLESLFLTLTAPVTAPVAGPGALPGTAPGASPGAALEAESEPVTAPVAGATSEAAAA